MATFSDLDVRHIDNYKRLLLNPLTYKDDVFGTFMVPFSFVTDFASLGKLKTPSLFIFYALLVGYGNKASVIHDYLYARQPFVPELQRRINRKEADEVYFRALREEGVARWRAYLFYFGVRIGAEKAWRRYAE